MSFSTFAPFAQSPANSLETRPEDQHLIAYINRPECTGSVSLLGGQVLSFHPKDHAHPLLWQNPEAQLQGPGAIRQGIPVCWPWFGALDKNPAPVAQQFQQAHARSHGLVREQLWQVESVQEHANATTVHLSIELTSLGLKLDVVYSFGKVLGISLTTTNLSSDTINLSYALHSYFAISHIDNISITDLKDVDYADGLDDFELKQQHGELRFDREVDRVFFNTPEQIELIDTGWQRKVGITCKDSHSAIVWNPWIEKSQRLSQFQADAYQSMLCIETAKAWDDYLSLAPQQAFTLDLDISLIAL